MIGDTAVPLRSLGVLRYVAAVLAQPKESRSRATPDSMGTSPREVATGAGLVSFPHPRSGPSEATGGTPQTTWTSRSRRRALIAAAAFLTLGLVLAGILQFSGQRDGQRLRRELQLLEAETYAIGIRARAEVWRLDGRLMRFQLSGDADEREAFLRDVAGWGPELEAAANNPRVTPAEAEALRATARAFQDYLAGASRFLERERPTVRRDTAERLSNEIGALSRPLLEHCEALIQVQRTGWDLTLAETAAALRSGERRLLFASLSFVGVFGGMALLAWLAWVRPLSAELRESELARLRQDRLAELGTVASGVVHELRHPLTALRTQAVLLRQSAGEASGEIDRWIDELRRLEKILEDFLQFARPAVPCLRPVRAGDVLNGVAALVTRPFAERRVQVHCEPGVGPLWLNADAAQLRQVFLNLTRNAAECMPHGGTITLRAKSGIDQRASGTRPVVMLEVEDTGTGIPPEIASRLFLPFVSGKPGGTGLGLSIASRLVTAHGGHIQFQTEPGRGTLFTVVLPQSDDSREESS
jgi:signal transduction histidine kinase